MVIRILTALIGGPLLLLITWFGGWYLAILVVLLAALGFKEFIGLGQKAGLIKSPILSASFSVLWLALFLLQQTKWLIPLLFVWFVVVFGKYAVRFPAISFAGAAFEFLTIIYPVAFFTFLSYLRELPSGVNWCFFAFLLVWVTDTGAFFIGNALGKRKLAPQVSPNKSVEGAIGGVVAACCFGVLFYFVTRESNLALLLGLSFLLSIVSQLGDLFESAIKRTAGVKDSGTLIPGHGGILDRFDSFLFVIPVVYFSLALGLVG